MFAVLSLASTAAWADVTLEANGETGTVEVAPGGQVDLVVLATDCPPDGDVDFWRDTWDDQDGIGLPENGQQDLVEASPCDTQRAQSFTAPDAPGDFRIEFLAEYCTGPGNSCKNSFDDNSVTFGRDSVTIVVPGDVGDPAQLDFAVQPTNTIAGQVVSPAVEVRIEDTDGNLVSDSTLELTIAIDSNPGGGALSGTTTVNAVDGIATFDDLSINELGDGYTLQATGTDLDQDTSAPFDIVPPEQEANAFEPDTPAGAVVGNIRTKVYRFRSGCRRNRGWRADSAEQQQGVCRLPSGCQ